MSVADVLAGKRAWWVEQGDCLAVLPTLPDACVDAVVTDPPAGISFMGKEWDDPQKVKAAGYDTRFGTMPPVAAFSRNPSCRQCGGRQRAGPATKPCVCGKEDWNTVDRVQADRAAFVAFLTAALAECLRVAKPGARLLCWAIPRTSHWTGTAVEDAGWILEDKVYHVHGQGFPKAKSKLKPAVEEWHLARKPSRAVPELNIDACRIGTSKDVPASVSSGRRSVYGGFPTGENGNEDGHNPDVGRYPANLVHDGSGEVLEAFAAFGDTRPGHRPRSRNTSVGSGRTMGQGWRDDWEVGECPNNGYGDSGTAARFFYCCKADRADRGPDNHHPTVKGQELMRWLCRLITPKGGVVLDPFAGSGSTLKAAVGLGYSAVGIEREPAYCEIARKRLREMHGPLFAED